MALPLTQYFIIQTARPFCRNSEPVPLGLWCFRFASPLPKPSELAALPLLASDADGPNLSLCLGAAPLTRRQAARKAWAESCTASDISLFTSSQHAFYGL